MDLLAPMVATVVRVEVSPGDAVRAGQSVVVLESMKMEHLVQASAAGVVAEVTVSAGDTVQRDEALISLTPVPAEAVETWDEQADLETVRADLAEVLRRHEVGLDANRPDAVRRRRERGQRTARENLADLCDPGTFVEYGPLVLAARVSAAGWTT